jgi:hypothetical protein
MIAMTSTLVVLMLVVAYRFGMSTRYTIRHRNKILYAVITACAILLLTILPRITFSQKVVVGKLEIPAKATYNLESDTLIVEQLILSDSAKLVLTKSKHFIKANQVAIGAGCSVSGIGAPGESGPNGKPAPDPRGLCKPPVHGEAGVSGKNGEPGKDLIISVNSIKIASKLTIDIHGGNGGDGGNGGSGSHGSNTTPHCAGDGGNVGRGGSGGNGGNGGILTINYSSSTEVSYFVTKVNLINRGGYRGVGGEGGRGGMRGSGPSEKFSKVGLIGKPGVEGKYGADGRPLFYSIIKSIVDSKDLTSK